MASIPDAVGPHLQGWAERGAVTAAGSGAGTS